MALDALYQQVILDHYRHPHGRGLRDPFDAAVSSRNPTCGDEIELRVRLADGGTRLADVSYAGQGCSISQASASVLHELVSGAPLSEVGRTGAAFLELLHGRPPADAAGGPDEELLGDGVAFAGVARFPMRVKCAALPWTALREALVDAGATAGDWTGAPAGRPGAGEGTG